MLDIERKLELIKKACEDKKGIDIKIIDVFDKTPMANYFVIVSGNTPNQTKGIADAIEEKMSEIDATEYKKEGYQSGRWILLDYNDIIVHVFHKEEREFYNLEGLWSDIGEKNVQI